MAGNQLGKTLSAGNEVSFHVTGEYPDWWEGRRFAGATNWWVGNNSNELVREGPQRILLGEGRNWGTGTIPRSSLAGAPTMARGFPDLVDVVQVKHKTGSISTIQFKAYEQGRKSWQTATLRGGIWFDEEPPMDIYMEGLARITATSGLTLMTMTPLLGMSEVVLLFFPQPSTPYRALVQMEIGEANHFTPEERDVIIASYKEHQRDARARGLPMLGEGVVFPVARSDIEVPRRKIPSHWHQLGGCDFGYGDHPFAAALVHWDKDADTLYVTHAYKEKKPEPHLHVSSLRGWGDLDALRFAYPHDGSRQWGNSGPVKDVYRREGMRFLAEHSTFLEGGYSPEAAAQQVLARMQTGRFKIFEDLEELFYEISTYHRKDGFLVQENDDLLSAVFKTIMMQRYFRQPVPSGMTYSPTVQADWDEFSWGKD